MNASSSSGWMIEFPKTTSSQFNTIPYIFATVWLLIYQDVFLNSRNKKWHFTQNCIFRVRRDFGLLLSMVTHFLRVCILLGISRSGLSSSLYLISKWNIKCFYSSTLHWTVEKNCYVLISWFQAFLFQRKLIAWSLFIEMLV